MSTRPSPSGFPFFEWVNRRIGVLSIAVVVVAVGLGIVGPFVAAEGEPSYEPGGEIYDTQNLVDDRFTSTSPIRGASFVVEASGAPFNPTASDHDVLTANALREFKAYSDAARAAGGGHMVQVFDHDLGVPIDGILSIADAVDAAIPGGLAQATDADVKVALGSLLADASDTANLRFTLSRLATRDLETIGPLAVVVWRSPAFFAQVRYDIDTFDPDLVVEGLDGTTNLDAERWLRTIQTDLRGDQVEIQVLGVV
ncbi:hypothetical protein HQ535_00760, partial [bacterium]|nr:hypothetical protein [bacterium]